MDKSIFRLKKIDRSRKPKEKVKKGKGRPKKDGILFQNKKVLKDPERLNKKFKSPYYGIKDILKYCRSTVNKTSELSEAELKFIINAFNKKLQDAIVDKGAVIRLPYRLGKIGVLKTKYDISKIQHVIETKNAEDSNNKYRLNLPLEAYMGDAYNAKFYWLKRRCLVPYSKYYSLTPVNHIKLRVSEYKKKLDTNRYEELTEYMRHSY